MKLAATLLALATALLAGSALAAAPNSSPSQQCRTERADANFATSHGGKTFVQHYGANKKTTNAFGKCVATKAKAKAQSTTSTQTETQSQSSTRAEAVCSAERADVNFPAVHENKTFAQYYGTNAEQNNAFGKCVSAKAKAS